MIQIRKEEEIEKKHLQKVSKIRRKTLTKTNESKIKRSKTKIIKVRNEKWEKKVKIGDGIEQM